MIALIVSFLLVAFAVFAVLPTGLAWLPQTIAFLQGAAPVFAAIIGIIAFFVGVADIKDKSEARAEENAKD